ncbi:MAG: DUF1653 domain-containing protein [Pseudomonadota bacterium]
MRFLSRLLGRRDAPQTTSQFGGIAPQRHDDRSSWRATHRHKKGGLYRFIAEAVLEADRSDVVIYDDVDGQIWVRSKREFYDGRFAEVD